MLNPNAQALVDALRSGEYEQTRHHLRDENGYCCLGVGCDLHAKATGQQWEYDEYMGEEVVLPEAVRKYFGFRTDLGLYGPSEFGDYERALIDDNDGDEYAETAPKTFAEIADIIESEPFGLFEA